MRLLFRPSGQEEMSVMKDIFVGMEDVVHFLVVSGKSTGAGG